MVASQPGRQGAAAGPDGLVDALAQAAFTTMAVLTKAAADHDLSLTQRCGCSRSCATGGCG